MSNIVSGSGSKGISIIKTQPTETFHPSDFIALDDLDGLLEKQEDFAGFELLADTQLLVVRKRKSEKPEKEHFNTISTFDISDENTHILFIAKKEIICKCFMVNAITISFLTDTYSDPVFIALLKYSGKCEECCKIETASGKPIGFIKRGQGPDKTDFLLQSELEEKLFQLILVQLDGDRFVYDVWDGPTLVAGVSSENSAITIYSAGSLNVSTKVILLGFSFYLDGLTRGDDRIFFF